MAATREHPVAAALCGVLGILLVLVAVLLGYATRSIFNEWAFSDRITASLADPRFADYVAEQIANAVIKAKPDLVGVRPMLVGAGRLVVSSPPFRAAVRRSARAAHHAIMTGTGTEIVLGVQDLGVLVESAAATQPGIAKKIPSWLPATLARFQALPGGERVVRLVRLANRLRTGTFALLGLGIVLCGASVRLSRDRRRAFVRIGIGLAVAGLLLAIVARFGGDVLALFARRATSAPALDALASAFLRGLMRWAVGLAFSGLVLAAASASLLERIPLGPWGDHLRQWLLGPQERMRWRLVRGLVGFAIGTALLFTPLASVIVLAWVIGAVVAFAGIREAFVAALHLVPQLQAPMATSAAGGPRRQAVLIVTAIAVVLIASASWIMLRPGAAEPGAPRTLACNGSTELCDRSVDQVVFPSTHNSMGAADVSGWMFPSQNGTIRQQLDDGVRGFLIDVHYGVPVEDKIRTEVQNEQAAMAKYESFLGKDGMEAVLRIRDRLRQAKPGPRGVYLCHGFCELGALPLVPELRQMHDFLVANPGEVIIVMIQDEAVSPHDVERCFQESGLIDFVYRGPARPPWPTLGELVETDQRVIVMAENDTTGVSWYHPAFEVCQETPYGFRDTTQFSNQPNRGGTGGSLLLMNHWIETVPAPKPSNAAIVNSRRFLMQRIQSFQRQRGRLPNVVAVDFYSVGDLIDVARELNTRATPNRRLGTPSAAVAARAASR